MREDPLPEQFLSAGNQRRRLHVQRLRKLEQSGESGLADAALHLRHERAVHIRAQRKLFLRHARGRALLSKDAPEGR